jgi:Cu2+-containing amine oxidase
VEPLSIELKISMDYGHLLAHDEQRIDHRHIYLFDLQIMIDVSLVGANFAAKGKTNQGGQAVRGGSTNLGLAACDN